VRSNPLKRRRTRNERRILWVFSARRPHRSASTTTSRVHRITLTIIKTGYSQLLRGRVGRAGARASSRLSLSLSLSRSRVAPLPAERHSVNYRRDRRTMPPQWMLNFPYCAPLQIQSLNPTIYNVVTSRSSATRNLDQDLFIV